MGLIKSNYRRAYEVMLSDGSTLTMLPHGSAPVADDLLDSPHLQEHVKAGRLSILTTPEVAADEPSENNDGDSSPPSE